MRHIIVLLIFSYLAAATADSGNQPPLAPALYVFGDSLFDSGNNNLLPTLAKADFLPYGMNFIKGSGRFTNGKTVADFIAEHLRLPYAPPALRISLSTPVTGLNYASGSCGIRPETGSFLGKCLSLDEQIDLFEKTINFKLKQHFKSSDELNKYLSESIYIISAGSNDYLNYVDSSKGLAPREFGNLVLAKFSRTLERLYNLGGRKIVVFEVGPIGCIPKNLRQLKAKIKGKCVEEANQLVSVFNKRLARVLQTLTSNLPASKFVLGHVHGIGYDAILNPSKYGLNDVSNPCCTTWGNGTSACIPWLPSCPNPNSHYFFDGFHLTENVYSVLASHCINNKTVCNPPINDLVNM